MEKGGVLVAQLLHLGHDKLQAAAEFLEVAGTSEGDEAEGAALREVAEGLAALAEFLEEQKSE